MGTSGQLRFDGRVAIVTGAGGNPGLGRAYARLLAARGARVVVNDLGVGPDGRTNVPASAQAVVDEIVAAGGEAVASTASVADRDGAEQIVATALDTWGRVDALINNAGVVHLARFDEIAPSDVERIVDVHLLGHIWMCRAVWPHMKEAGYGRIVNVTSRSMKGGHFLSIYGAAKAAIISLTRSLAVEGDEHGIVVNALSPHAATVATFNVNEESDWLREAREIATPELVAPVAAYLAHEECGYAGRVIEALEGNAFEIVLARTKGYSNRELTIEDVRDNSAAIVDRVGLAALPDAIDAARSGKAFKPIPYVPPAG